MILTTKIFAQNIVIGGSPPIFLTISKEDQNDFDIFMVFDVKFLNLLRVAISVDEYRARKTQKEDIEVTAATISHLLLLNEDTPMILFTDSFLTRLVNGVTRVNSATTPIITVLFIFSAVQTIRMMGIIFCQLIMISMVVCFISIILISLRYHVCIGHTPIFARSLMKTKNEDNVVGC